MNLQDYARIREIESLLVAGSNTDGLVAELQALCAMIGAPVVISDQAQYDAIAAKQPAVAQEELDGMRNFENSQTAASPAAVFIAPGTQPAPPSSMLNRAQVRDLFTFAEKIGIDNSADPGVKVFLSDLAARDTVDILHPRFAQCLDYLISKGLLTIERKADIQSNVQV